ncbi:MAG: hypothetical protein ACI9YL_001689 [Luteibaculaceae bacterium]|jgi:hypothetical protein
MATLFAFHLPRLILNIVIYKYCANSPQGFLTLHHKALDPF